MTETLGLFRRWNGRERVLLCRVQYEPGLDLVPDGGSQHVER